MNVLRTERGGSKWKCYTVQFKKHTLDLLDSQANSKNKLYFLFGVGDIFPVGKTMPNNRKSLVVKLVLSNRLLINDAKTEFVIIGSRLQVSKIHIQLRNLWSNPTRWGAIKEHALILI